VCYEADGEKSRSIVGAENRHTGVQRYSGGGLLHLVLCVRYRIKQFRCFFFGAGGSRAATIACILLVSRFTSMCGEFVPHRTHPSAYIESMHCTQHISQHLAPSPFSHHLPSSLETSSACPASLLRLGHLSDRFVCQQSSKEPRDSDGEPQGTTSLVRSRMKLGM
jgi:hypothetical protein